jgi:UDP-2,4-diacetamido-2,4,6-trideoxy-beta-L-altropyranose hydrolase
MNIAAALRSRGSRITFICRDLESNGLSWLASANFDAIRLPRPKTACKPNAAKPKHLAWLGVSLEEEIVQSKAALRELGGADLLLVDSYALDRRYESAMRPFARKIAVLDDLADRAHDCDLLIDGAYMRETNDYLSLVSKQCRLLCGSAFAPLSPDYGRYRALALPRRFPPRVVLLSMGGIDLANLTGEALKALAASPFNDAAIVAVLSARAPHIAENEKLGRKLGLRIDWRFDARDMPLLILRADLGVGALGVGSYERACLALASVTMAAADNQRENLARLGAAGAIFAENTIGDALSRIDEARVRSREKAAFNICDGTGAARICDEIQSAALR